MPKPEDDWILREAEYLKVVSNLRGTGAIGAELDWLSCWWGSNLHIINHTIYISFNQF